jgi:hypothetical protein
MLARPKRLMLMCFCLCFASCTRGIGKRDVDQSPLPLFDVVTGDPITQCLVVPVYSRARGVFFGGEGRLGDDSVFVSHPFVYRHAEAFRPTERGGGMIGLPGGGFAAGNGWGLDSIIVVAPGYRARLIWGLWGRKRENFGLMPLKAAEVGPYLRRLSSILSTGVISREDQRFIGRSSGEPLVVDFSAEERQLVASFFAAVIQ